MTLRPPAALFALLVLTLATSSSAGEHGLPAWDTYLPDAVVGLGGLPHPIWDDEKVDPKDFGMDEEPVEGDLPMDRLDRAIHNALFRQPWKRVFPLYKARMPKHSQRKIPDPVGLSGYAIWVKQQMDFQNLDIRLAAAPGRRINLVELSEATTESVLASFRADFLVLPFLSVFATVGKVQGESTFSGMIDNPLNPGEEIKLPVEIDFDGLSYGGGAAIVYEMFNWFVLADGSYHVWDLNKVSTIRVINFAFRSGYRREWRVPGFGNIQTALWVGTMRIDYRARFSGDFTFRPNRGPVEKVNILYSVNLVNERPWNMLTGAQLILGRHFFFAIEGGFIGRKQVLGQIQFRF